VRRSAGAHEQAAGERKTGAPERSRDLETEEPAKAVPEDGVRPVQNRTQRDGEGLDERGEAIVRRLRDSALPPGKVDQAELDVAWKRVPPGAESRRPSPRVWKAEEA